MKWSFTARSRFATFFEKAWVREGVHVYDDHWSPEGHDVTAGVLARALEAIVCEHAAMRAREGGAVGADAAPFAATLALDLGEALRRGEALGVA